MPPDRRRTAIAAAATAIAAAAIAAGACSGPDESAAELAVLVAAPARIQAEAYDRAHEATPATNSGGQCNRGDGVDMELTTDAAGGGCNVGWTDAGEWLELRISSGSTRNYDVNARVASDVAGGRLHIELDGASLGNLDAPASGWQSWHDRGYRNVRVTAGDHVLRVVFDTGLVNLNFVELSAGSPSCSDGVRNGNETGVDCGGSCPACPSPPGDITFFVVSDTHADPPESYDLRATARAINAVAQNGTWPQTIGGVATHFTGGRIAAPQGVVFVGDITGWGVAPTEIPTFRRYFEQGNTAHSIGHRSYVGLGNHDLDDADRSPGQGADYRGQFWAYVDGRHKASNAPVPVTSFDAASHAYSWDAGGVHLVQLHRFPGDRNYGLTSSLEFLRQDLQRNAGSGRPVVLFHHYGMDGFGTQDRWWTAADRSAYRSILRGYNVVAIFAGHSHAAMQYTWESLRVFHANNAKAEIGTGNRDGNGSFAIVRITGSRLDVVTARWLDDTGRYELIAPYYSGAASPGPAP